MPRVEFLGYKALISSVFLNSLSIYTPARSLSRVPILHIIGTFGIVRLNLSYSVSMCAVFGVILIHISFNAHLYIFFYEVPVQVLFIFYTFFFFCCSAQHMGSSSPTRNEPMPYSGSVGPNH